MMFGSLVPGMSPMQFSPTPAGGGPKQQGMDILMAALKQQQQLQQQQKGQPLSLAAPGLLSPWLQPPVPGTLPDAGGPGPAPNMTNSPTGIY